jgi:hypothetical protein
MKNVYTALATATLGLVLALPNANASPILRAGFNANATTYNLSGATINSVTATNGDATLLNGIVSGYGNTSLPAPTYYDGGDSSVIRIDFLNPVSAFGLDWFANNANPTLSVFNSSNVLLESLTLDWTKFSKVDSYPTGFIGLNVSSNAIAYATIDTPLNGGELYVDNLIYQRSATVPVPATLPLLCIGALGLIANRRRKAG